MAPPNDDETAEPPSASPASRRLPTRVNKACRRCRRNKSRCDSFRPCSLCLRANVDCQAAEPDKPPSPTPQSRAQRRGSNLRKRPRSRSRSSGRRSPPESRARQSTVSEHNASETVAPQPWTADSPVQSDPPGSWVPVDYAESESAMGIARKIYRLGSQNIDDHMTSAIPDGGNGTWTTERRRGDKRQPISAILRSRFPNPQLINSLLEDYFDAVHWFSLVIYEPRFRQRLSSIADGYAYPSDESFLTLLSMILCMAAWYRSKRTNQDDSKEWSSDLLQIVESRLVQLMDQRSIAAVQTCILLGSHHVYHGRPNLSFALLGATIKISQAMGLHRKVEGGDPHENEERKRVWWTVYTWDRFASISYGRPLSINDEDFTVGMPAEFSESPYFVRQSDERDETGIVYSSYQRELNKMYLIASPVLKTIFGSLATPTSKQRFSSDFASLVNEVTQKLTAWRHQLPPYLMLDLSQDYQPENSGWSTRAHVLQSLSLQLTFDNLMIVLYRPFLSRKVEHLSMNVSGTHAHVPEITEPSGQFQTENLASQANNISVHDHVSPMSEATASSEYWWSAAVRTAHVTELPQLAQIATDSHLVAFMAMNLFNAAIVLISLALSDPLSDRAQGAKRSITRVFRLQELLGQRSALSRQSSVVLKNLIYLLLRREVEAMLAPVPAASTQAGLHMEQQPLASSNAVVMSVGDTLRLPLEAALSTSDQVASGQTWSNLSRRQRLNESLASVQRVFPPFQDQQLQSDAILTPNNGGMEDGTIRLPQQQMWQGSLSQSGNYTQPQTMNHEEGNDLFWLWDVTWDAGYGQ